MEWCIIVPESSGGGCPMASVLHGSARTTPRIRAELQASQESARSLAARYDLNPKTVRKWRQRTTTADAPMGPKAPKSTVLTPAEEAIVVAFRQKTLLPLDDVLGCLRDTIPNLSRSALHRWVRRFRSGPHQGETWRVWGSAGHHGLARDCHESKPSFKRAVAWMQAQLAA